MTGQDIATKIHMNDPTNLSALCMLHLLIAMTWQAYVWNKPKKSVTGQAICRVTDFTNIAGARESDGGLYTCQVKSQAGQSSASAWVTVVPTPPRGGGVAAPPPPDLLDFPASPGGKKLDRKLCFCFQSIHNLFSPN